MIATLVLLLALALIAGSVFVYAMWRVGALHLDFLILSGEECPPASARPRLHD